MSKIITDEEISIKYKALQQFLEQAREAVEKAKESGNQEAVVTYTFLETEYQQMLEEFENYYDIKAV